MEDGQDTVLGQSTLEKAVLVKAYPDDSPFGGNSTPDKDTLDTVTQRTAHPEDNTPPSPGSSTDYKLQEAAVAVDQLRSREMRPELATLGSLPAATCRGTRTCRAARRELPGFHSRQSCPTQILHPRLACPRRSLPGVRLVVVSDTHGCGLGSSAVAATVPERAGSGASSCPAGAPGISDSSSSRQSPAGCGFSPPRRPLGR